MANHNDAPYLRLSVESILNQSFSDFEFIIFDDASSDESWQILLQYAQQDKRIQLIQNPENLGLTKSLNRGLFLARGKYIARMDADDVSLKDRLAVQIKYMDAYPRVAACGCWSKTIGSPAGHIWRYPLTAEEIKYSLLFHAVLTHPTVLFRTALLQQQNIIYNENYEYAQDYALWVELAQYFPIVNIPQILLHYRCHAKQRGESNKVEQQAVANQVRRSQLERLGIQFTAAELAVHNAVGSQSFSISQAFIQEAEAWLIKLREWCLLSNQASSFAIQKVFADQWFASCNLSTALGRWIWARFWQSPLSRVTSRRSLAILKFAVKCGLKYRQ